MSTKQGSQSLDTQSDSEKFSAGHQKGATVVVSSVTTGDGHVDQPVPVEFPEGGLRAWLCVLGAFCVTFATFGFFVSWGVFQLYYKLVPLRHKTESEISWIGSVQFGLAMAPSLIAGRIFDMGWFRLPMAIASTVLVISVFMIAHCTEYWHFVLCQGVAVGISSGFLIGPVITVVSHWFHAKRSTAVGILMCGNSIGGVIFPILTRNAFPEVGFQWTCRICGFLIMGLLIVANLTMRPRLPPKNTRGGLVKKSVFMSAPLQVYAWGLSVGTLGMYTVLYYISVSAKTDGVDTNMSFYLVAIANAASFFGRLAAGIASDKLGALNVVSLFAAVTAASSYAWPHAHSLGTLIVVAIVYGFFSGGTVGMAFVIPAYMGDISEAGLRVGLAQTIVALGTLGGPPAAGEIFRRGGSFKEAGIFAGSMLVFANLSILFAKYLKIGKVFSGKM